MVAVKEDVEEEIVLKRNKISVSGHRATAFGEIRADVG